MARDAVLEAAVDLARDAAADVALDPGYVGDHLGVVAEAERLLTHRFAALAPGYPGWEWQVTLARVPRGRTATVSEVGLLAGSDAVRAPEWVPWSDRLQPGDLGPADVLPLIGEDPRLEFGYESTSDADADELAIYELGLGRERVLSLEGRRDASQRWYTGSRGPTAPSAITSAQPCSTCGFLVLLAGALRTEFGVCANEWSPDDGKVVSMDHGCGAHSQTDIDRRVSQWRARHEVVSDLEVEVLGDLFGEAADETSEGDVVDADEDVVDEDEPGAEPSQS